MIVTILPCNTVSSLEQIGTVLMLRNHKLILGKYSAIEEDEGLSLTLSYNLLIRNTVDGDSVLAVMTTLMTEANNFMQGLEDAAAGKRDTIF